MARSQSSRKSKPKERVQRVVKSTAIVKRGPPPKSLKFRDLVQVLWKDAYAGGDAELPFFPYVHVGYIIEVTAEALKTSETMPYRGHEIKRVDVCPMEYVERIMLLATADENEAMVKDIPGLDPLWTEVVGDRPIGRLA